MIKDKYNVIGIMSGTSLDGADLVMCSFTNEKGKWSFEILKADTFPYSIEWQNILSNANMLNAYEFVKLHKDYGYYLGELVNNFLLDINIRVDFIASHGHTVFHTPNENITFQIGCGACIAAKANITTISDFRTLDVALNGQGAPLVPIGDELLFSNYDYCINLGGFSNISFNNNGIRYAFDICPVNIAINYYTKQLNLDFDKDGKIATSGHINTKLFDELNNIEYYKLNYPKSLGREWLYIDFMPMVDKYKLGIENKLRTIYEHIAFQINKLLCIDNKKSVLMTGGGVHNKFLIDLIKNSNANIDFIIPQKEIIDFKEAIIFAFLGILRYRNETNCLASVTGADKDSCSGVINLI